MVQLPIPKKRDLFLSGKVDTSSIQVITSAIVDINDDDRYISRLAEISSFNYNPMPIMLYIDSYGGLAYQCFGLIGVIKNSITPLNTIVTGCAMSSGFLIAIAGHKRFCFSRSTYLYHQVSSVHLGKLADLEDDLNRTKLIQKNIEEHTIANTKITKSQLSKNYREKTDWTFSPMEAIKYGIVDTIL